VKLPDAPARRDGSGERLPAPVAAIGGPIGSWAADPDE
jgi:hypothetical protein